MWPRSEVLGSRFFGAHSDFFLGMDDDGKTQNQTLR
jgi:hypothetical protein